MNFLTLTLDFTFNLFFVLNHIQNAIGVYCYIIMPFELKKAGATYHCARSTIFCDHLRKIMECYVDDIAVKSRSKGNHLNDLRTVFDIMRAHH